MEVSLDGKSFTFTWKLKNFSFLWHREHQFLKWTFKMKRNINTSWSLLIYPSTPKNCISCILKKESEVFLDFLVDYELSFLHEDGSPLHSIKVSSADFNYKSKSVQLWLHHDEILEKKGISLEDTISVRCRMRTLDAPIQEMVKYFAETEVKVQRCTLIWFIIEFSDFKPGKKRIKFVKTLNGNTCIYFSLFPDKWGGFIFEIFFIDPKLVELCKCQIFLVDSSGGRLKCGRFQVVTIGKTTDPDWKFPLSITKRNLMDTKELYLPNDTLTLQCEVAFSMGIEAEPVQKLETNYQSLQNPCDAETSNISKPLKKYPESLPACKNDMQFLNNPNYLKGEFVYLNLMHNDSPTSLKANTISNSLLSWKDDLLILYENGTFCDAELLVATSCFPVHSLILSIRSPVFCDQFTCEAKSNGKKTSIHIKDLDADTVEKMIIFLYTDTLEDLQWDCAKGLYLASNKYEISPLKDISASFLKQNLSTINCCDILLLAEKHKDDDMKQEAKDFIAKNDEVLNSDQWRSLEESYSYLTIETFRYMLLNFRKR